VTNLVGQVGCLTGIVALVIIGVAFIAGRFLDNYFGTQGVFTVIFMLGSFPITLFAMVKISLHLVAKAQKELNSSQEEQSESETTEKEETPK
jgi:F0F1-type ATP synthase assembly protein I